MPDQNHTTNKRENGDLNPDCPGHYLLPICSQSNQLLIIQDEECGNRQTFIKCLIFMKCFT